MRKQIRDFLGVALAACVCLGVLPSAWAANSGEVELSREAKAAIQLAQQYSAAQQRADGCFGSSHSASPGIVAAGVLGWMVSGSLPGEGPYGKQVAKGVDYILSNQQPSGYFCKAGQGTMYEQGLACICLAEVWGHTQDKRIYDKLKKGIDLIIRCQNEKGGWRYQPKIADDDLSVTVFQILALRAAKDAGIAVPKETIDRALKYVESCRTQKDSSGLSGFSYGPGGSPNFAMTSAGLMSLMLCGKYKASGLKDGLDYLVRAREKKEDSKHGVYGHYYAAQAMYQAGGQGDRFNAYWMKWFPDISKGIISNQTKTGQNRGMLSSEHGIWGHAMCILTLGIPYRYLPIYQR